MSKMGVLFYTTGRNLSASAGFMEFRNLAVAFAESWMRRGLYGFTSRDVCQVRNAFASVGLGNGDSNCDGREETDPDRDRDGIPDSIDNCREIPNPDQRDGDGDHLGDACDPDHDNDGFWDARDNCPLVANPDQRDSDHNGVGDACQDSDGDGIVDQVDNCLNVPNPDQTDTDSDGQGNVCDSDDDNDGILDTDDNCRLVANRNQWDDDGDGVGSACDNCVTASNRDQRDTDADRIGDACDPDADNDGIPNEIDNCPYRRNPDQTDLDGNGIGTACDDDIRRTLVADMTKLVLWGSPGRSIRIPLPPPVCPDCLAPTWYPQNFCAALSLEGLDTRVNLLLTTDDGRAVSRGSRMNDSTVEMRYHPFGGVQYFLNLFFEPDFDFTQPLVTALSFNQADCGIPYPRQLTLLEAAETPSGVKPLALKAGGTPDLVYYGQCTQNEPTVINFEAFAEGDTSSITKLGIRYTYFNAEALPVMGDFIEMTPTSGGAYAASMDMNLNAASALSNGAGTIQFFAQAQDSAGNVLAQSDSSQITVYPYKPVGVTVIPPVKPPTPTPSPLPPPTCSSYTNSNACGIAGCYWWWSNNTCHASPEPATPTLPPPPLVCSDYNGDSLACTKYGCYYWTNMTCNPDPDPCHKYDGDQTSCESVGCSYDTKNNTCNTP